jgi:hypothetical protein
MEMTGEDKLALGSRKAARRRCAPLDRRRQQPLMASAVAGNSTRGHFPALSDELRNRSDILVIDLQGLVGAETTHLRRNIGLRRGAPLSSSILSRFVLMPPLSVP